MQLAHVRSNKLLGDGTSHNQITSTLHSLPDVGSTGSLVTSPSLLPSYRAQKVPPIRENVFTADSAFLSETRLYSTTLVRR